MRRYHSWLAAIGFAAATPGLALAGPLSLFSGDSQKSAAEPDAKTANQKTANDIAKALRAARLNGYNIEVEYKNGAATLIGDVPTAQQRDMAAQVTRQVPGVKSVINQLGVKQADKKTAALPATAAPAARKPQAPIQQAEFENPRPAAAPAGEVDNQAMADQIAQALRSQRFSGQGVGIEFQNGVAQISGMVADPGRRSQATAIISRVPGVKRVDNQLEVMAAAPQRRPAQPIQRVQYDPSQQGVPMDQQMMGPPMTGPMAGGPMSGAPQGGYGAYPAGAMMQGGPQPMQTAMAMNGSNPAIYDQPNLPEHAWPAYASYPNYAAVSYPKQYSASAWPYIGPFYPYPQVPLGWRKVQLEWDDGYWQLNFRARTERWWWFMDYRNW